MGKNMIFSPDSGGFPPFADPQKPFGFAAEIIPGSRRGLFFLSHLKRDVSGCFGEILQKEHQHRNASLPIRNHGGHHELAI
jgi:hypothetical protein